MFARETAGSRVRFQNNRLCFTSQAFCFEIGGWPRPHARQKTVWNDRWTSYRPAIDFKASHIGSLVLEAHGDLRSALATACNPFFSAVPDRVRSAVGPFPVGDPVRAGQWDLFRLAGRAGEPALDLMASNPVLAFLVAAQQDTLGQNPGDLVCVSQKILCAHLGFPATRWMGKLLRKMTCEDLQWPLLQALQQAIHDESVVKLLQHVSRISADGLGLVLDPAIRPHLSVPLLEEVADQHYDRAGVWMRQTLSLAATLDKPLDRLVFSSMAEVWQLQDRLTQERGKRRQHNLARQLVEGRPPSIIPKQRARSRARPRPRPRRRSAYDPPLPGTDAIRPLTSALLIRHWANQQHNCMASRIGRVQKGDYYLYQILSPEEASLGIEYQKGRWKIHELKARCNRSVLPQTKTMVKAWLRKRQSR